MSVSLFTPAVKGAIKDVFYSKFVSCTRACDINSLRVTWYTVMLLHILVISSTR